MTPTIDWTKIKASPIVPDVDPVAILILQIAQRAANIEKMLNDRKQGEQAMAIYLCWMPTTPTPSKVLNFMDILTGWKSAVNNE